MASGAVRVRFAPSPTGYLHVGGARTALFNWLLARKLGGRFILRIEDTDQGRNLQDSLPKILQDLRWLGLQWDEGPEVGGDYGPYLQSQRLALYHDYARRLLEAGDAYYSWESREELEALREQARLERRPYKYRRPDPLPGIAQGEDAKRTGRPVVVRFKMPEADVTVRDQILGDVEIKRAELEDFVILKADGWPTYHFACVVDDELMAVTHVLRGQEHLMNTPKHVAMQQALGFRTPEYAHLTVICNMNGSKMSKRDKEKALAAGLKPPEIDVHDFRVSGYLPEALINFISLLGWSTGDETEQLALEETVRRFDIGSIGKSSAKFDREKLLAFNTDWAARLPAQRLLEAFQDFLSVNAESGSGTHDALRRLDDATLQQVLKANEGFRTFQDVVDKTAVLFAPDDSVEYDAKAVKKVLEKSDGQGYALLEAVSTELQGLDNWSREALETAIAAFCERRGVKLGDVAQPLRVAATGRTVSPPIYDTLALLGQRGTLSRIRSVVRNREGVPNSSAGAGIE